VHLWDATTRVRLRVIGRGWGAGKGLLRKPCGLRLSRDGLHVVVVDAHSDRVCVFRVEDGTYIGTLATAVRCVACRVAANLLPCRALLWGWEGAAGGQHLFVDSPSSQVPLRC
jgi:hypothetical protein